MWGEIDRSGNASRKAEGASRGASFFHLIGLLICISTLCRAQTYTITTVAGGGSNYPGNGGPATSAAINSPVAVAVDAAGNLYFVDGNDLRKVSTQGILSTLAGSLDSSGYTGDGGPAIDATFNNVDAVALDSSGNIFLGDYDNWVVRKITASTGVITTVAGNGKVESSPGGTGDGGPATSAQLSGPTGVAVDSGGNLYIADNYVHRIRKVTPGGVISNYAGTGIGCCTGAGGPAVNATLSAPEQIAVDTAGDLFMAESNNDVQEVTTNGILENVAGNMNNGFSGDGGPATSAELTSPIGVAVDSSGNVYIADTFNYVIRKVSGGTITTIAGTPGVCGYSGDGGPATSATLCRPMGLAVSGNNIYIADYENGVVRMLTPNGGSSGAAPTILSGGILNAASYAVVNGAGAPVAPGSLVAIFTSSLAAQAANFTGTSLPDSLGGVSVKFNGITAPVAQVVPTGAYPFVSAQVPFEVLPAGQTSATVPAVITVNNTPSAAVQISIVASAPGIFTIPPTGLGNAVLVYLDPTTNAAAIAGPAGALGYPSAPIPRGTSGFFYVNGLGAMTPPVADGSGTCPASNSECSANATPQVLIGGVPAQVQFAGQAPGFPGAYQVNIMVPANAPAGSSVSLVVKSADGTVTSNAATIAVQ